VRDPEPHETLARAELTGGNDVLVTSGILGLGALLRALWHLPIPLSVFGAGLMLLAGDLWLRRLPPRLPQSSFDRVNFFHYLLDVCIITFIVNQLGGADWIGAFFYLFVILNANVSLRRTHGLIVTSACVAAFVSSLLLTYHGLLPPAALFPGRAALDRDPGYIAVVILLVGVGVFVLFGLSFATFAAVLRTKTRELSETNARLRQAAEQLRGHRDELEQAVERRTRDLKAALSHLRSAHQEVKRMDQLKTNFLANVSHELRTPLTSIRSFAEILLKFPDEESSSREEFLQIIATEADRLARLIDDVLDITKIESGHMDWNFSSVELSSLVSFCVRSIGPLAAAKNLSVRLDLPVHLPPVRADRDRIAQVLNNLLANALKFTEQGEVTVGAAMCGEHIRLYVSDTGPGIPETEREQIFTKFHQISDGLTTKPRGTGLGLAICAEIIANHGGRIWVDGIPGRGSTFHFTLPAERSDFAERPRLPRPQRRRVLIAGADAQARKERREPLEQAGYDVEEAADGREALRLATLHKPDLICVDVLTPDMSGLALLRTLRAGKDTRHIPVMTVSGMEDKGWALELGAACHLVEPVAGDALVAAAAKVLAAREQRGASDSSQETPRV